MYTAYRLVHHPILELHRLECPPGDPDKLDAVKLDLHWEATYTPAALLPHAHALRAALVTLATKTAASNT